MHSPAPCRVSCFRAQLIERRGRREEARSIIQRGVNAGSEHAVLFTGSGATGASCKLCALVRLLPQWSPLPVVIVSTMEHHSNILPWRESGAVVLTVGQPGYI
jgi:selenocysteine lyase/cysteine desulfurase